MKLLLRVFNTEGFINTELAVMHGSLLMLGKGFILQQNWQVSLSVVVESKRAVLLILWIGSD